MLTSQTKEVVKEVVKLLNALNDVLYWIIK